MLPPGTQSHNADPPAENPGLRPYLIGIAASSMDAGVSAISGLQGSISSEPQTTLREFTLCFNRRCPPGSVRSFAIGRDCSSISKELEKPRATARWKASTCPAPSIGFVFTGQGIQAYNMGCELRLHSLAFASVLRKYDSILARVPEGPDWSIEAEMMREETDSRLLETRFSQLICTALQLALVEMLKTLNIQPTAVCGHSSGEIAAAYVASIWSLEAAITIAYYRGLCMDRGMDIARAGAMLSVDLSEAKAEEELRPFGRRLGIAAVNSPLSVSIRKKLYLLTNPLSSVFLRCLK